MTVKSPPHEPGPVATPLPPGRQLLPGYRVSEHLARGRTVDVYAVWSGDRHCLCVAKTLRPDCGDHTTAGARLLEEGRLLERLSHPHLVRCYEVRGDNASDDLPPTVILETLTGETLGHLIGRRRQGLPAADLAELGLQLSTVLRYLHRHGILHLDLKPSNIVAEAGRARLLDLGHARPPGPCRAGWGTREYMPPEQLVGGQVSESSDVYGLGGVLYRAATRRRPFGAAERDANPYRGPRLARLHRRALAPSLVDLIVGCLDPDPAGRPGLAQATAVLAGLAEHQPAPIDLGEPAG